MSRGTRVSAAQLERTCEQLSERDLTVLRSVRAYRLMRAEQLQRMHFHGHASNDTAKRICRRVLHRLHTLHLTRRLERRIGGIRAGSAGHIYAVTPLGHRLLGSDVRSRWREPSASFVAHTLGVAELASQTVRLARNAGHDVLAIEPEPEAWRIFHDGLAERTLKPDLALRLADQSSERSWFIEVDLATESRTVIWRKCQLYTNYWRLGIEQDLRGVFPRVLWVAPDAGRAEQIDSTLTRAGVEPRLFAVTTVDAAAKVLNGLEVPMS